MFSINHLNMTTPPIILLSRKQIHPQAWDDHILHSRQRVIYALSWYLDIVCERWEALVWPSADRFLIAMPLPVRSKLGRKILYQPLFCQYLGIFSSSELGAAQCAAFLEALAARFPYIPSYAFNPDNFDVINGLLPKSFQWQVLQTHWLHLDKPYEGIRAGYRKDRRKNLIQGLNAAWDVIESSDFEPLIRLFKENHAGGIGKVSAGAYQTLRRLGEQCIRSGAGRLLYARRGGLVHAGMLLVYWRGRAVYLFNSADRIGRKANARALMLDSYFRDHSQQALVFDFESPQKKSIATYYTGFGARSTGFYSIRRNALPFPLRQIQHLRQWLLIRTRQCLF